MTTRSFKYGLESLIKKRTWELEEEKRQEVELRREMEEWNRLVEEVLTKILSAESTLRESAAPESEFNATRIAALQEFLVHARQQLEERRQRAIEAERQHAGQLQKMHELHKSVKTLEKHKEGKKKEHELHWLQQELKGIDDQWLATNGRTRK
jgi:chromosome segregation ATPase